MKQNDADLQTAAPDVNAVYDRLDGIRANYRLPKHEREMVKVERLWHFDERRKEALAAYDSAASDDIAANLAWVEADELYLIVLHKTCAALDLQWLRCLY